MLGTRLNEQNQGLIDVAGLTIHPSIRSRLPNNGVLIAELGAGTGAFL
jgi:hypothetical protein